MIETTLTGGEQVSGDGESLAVENPYTAFQETKHAHIKTRLAPKDWWYPYGGGSPQATGSAPRRR